MIEPVKIAAKQFPDAALFYLMDAGASCLNRMEGRISGRNMARMVQLIHQAETLGAD